LRKEKQGNLYYNSDGILVDKEYVESQNLATKDEVKVYIDKEVEIIKSDIEGVKQQLNEESHFRGYLSTNAKIQALEATPNDFAYSAESGTKWVYDVENGWQDTGTQVPDQLTPASDATPLINGTASAGTANEYARGDHRHPVDTSRVGVEEFNEFKIENAEARKLKLLKTITLEEDVTSISVEFEKRIDEFVLLMNVGFLKAESKAIAARPKANWGYLFYDTISMTTAKRCFYAHTKKVANNVWETMFFDDTTPAAQGLSDSNKAAKISIHANGSNTLPSLNIFIQNVSEGNAMTAGSTIQIWGHEVDESV